MARLLPPDFAWYPPPTGTYSKESRCLRVGGEFGLEVAFVHQRLPGDWLSTVNRQADWRRQASRVAPSRELGMKWAGWWAAAHADRLRSAAAEWEKPRGKWIAFARPNAPDAASTVPLLALSGRSAAVEGVANGGHAL